MMKKSLITLLAILILSPFAVFALADPVNLQLNTIIDAVSTLQVNGGTTTATLVPGNVLSVGYTYVGNQLVKMKIISTNNFYLRHSDYAAHNTWVIPYSMTFDYGSGTQIAVVNGSSVNLLDTNGTYNLAKNMIFSAISSRYAAGSYSDTLTFEVVAQ